MQLLGEIKSCVSNYLKGKEYERDVNALFSSLKESGCATWEIVKYGNKNLITGKSGFKHQIDISLARDEKLHLIECKNLCKDIGVEAVMVLASRISDIQEENPRKIVQSSIVSKRGATSGAIKLAEYFEIRLDTFENPQNYVTKIFERGFAGQSVSLNLGAKLRTKFIPAQDPEVSISTDAD